MGSEMCIRDRVSTFSSLPLLLDRKDKLREVVSKSVVYMSVIVLPISYLLIAFSKPIVYILYGARYSIAHIYLALSASIGLLAPLGFYLIRPYLNSIGRTEKTLKISAIYFVIYAPLAIALIPMYSVIGAIVSNIVASLIATLYGAYILHKEFGLSIIAGRNIAMLILLSIPASTATLFVNLSLIHI